MIVLTPAGVCRSPANAVRPLVNTQVNTQVKLLIRGAAHGVPLGPMSPKTHTVLVFTHQGAADNSHLVLSGGQLGPNTGVLWAALGHSGPADNGGPIGVLQHLSYFKATTGELGSARRRQRPPVNPYRPFDPGHSP